MAQSKVTAVVVVDDLTGEELSADQHVAVRFGFGGQDYVLDTTQEGRDRVREALAPFVECATPVAGVVARDLKSQKVREWGRENGWDVGERGRLPDDLLEAYKLASVGRSFEGVRRPRRGVSEVREWGREHGWVVGERGRLPADLVEAYREFCASKE